MEMTMGNDYEAMMSALMNLKNHAKGLMKNRKKDPFTEAINKAQDKISGDVPNPMLEGTSADIADGMDEEMGEGNPMDDPNDNENDEGHVTLVMLGGNKKPM